MKNKIIFLGNGPLAEHALAILRQGCEVIFHARTREDLEEVCRLKREFPEAHGVLASFGVMIPSDVLELFEPEGILNIHPSLLPAYRGPSPIESAILNGDDEFSVSVMKLASKMDAGPVYYQATLVGLPLDKEVIYRELAEAGAKWMVENLNDLPTPVVQDDAKATYTEKLTKAMGLLTPETDTAEQTLRKIVAFAGFPKAKYVFYGVKCIVLEAHARKPGETAVLPLPCADGQFLSIDRLQPEGRKAMDAKAFANGYRK
ncbi:MAG: formyltransferase family protein [Candidatus Saccharibacteria bacterium]|nr:formyltransferase family protein [Candidatus Saccharibacteria bacterium]